MNYKTFKRLYFQILLVFIATSCTKPVDFEQAKDFEITPVIESSLIFFDEPANQFLDNGSEIRVVQDFVLVSFFDDEFIVDNLIKAEFLFEVENSIHRNFELQIDLFDDSNQLQHTFTVSAQASSEGDFIETFEGTKLQALKSTTAIVFTLRMLPGVPINQDTLGNIQLQSSAVFYFKIGDTQ
ncbi:hypothetical protein VOI54_07710 [Tamlana sp. 2201CG12-4]|uniref:hypothetical protein n=1 Tax=Tamlana sp. 2201CG12-4 TaxID=3112582 RepID=UPI002DB9AE1B|nr:hypothetical protein [Tamlana sp. 2201CG12-4]MEC3906901.1 hypothetical protein [Tamlana sp. 2201CG12-4]